LIHFYKRAVQLKETYQIRWCPWDVITTRQLQKGSSKGEDQGSKAGGQDKRQGRFGLLDALGCAHVEVCADEC
jgi:hypothetical protein